MPMPGTASLMSMESVQTEELHWCALICHKLQEGFELEFNFRNILLFNSVDTSGNVSKCAGFEFQQAED